MSEVSCQCQLVSSCQCQRRVVSVSCRLSVGLLKTSELIVENGDVGFEAQMKDGVRLR